MLFSFLPIFFDLGTLRFVGSLAVEPTAPVHIGFLVICFFICVNLLVNLFKGAINRQSGIFICLFLILLPATQLFTQVSLLVALQFLSILVFFPYGILSISPYIAKMLRFSMLCNAALLALLVVINVIFADPETTIEIYQAFVTFPASLILYAYTLLCFLPKLIESKNKFWLYLLIAKLSMILVLTLSLGRKVGFLDLLILIAVLHFAFRHYNIRLSNQTIYMKKRIGIIVGVLYVPSLILLANMFLKSNVFARFADSLITGDVDGSRLNNWSDGLNSTFESLKSVFFGADIKSMMDTNFHNFFFDTSVRFGLPVTLVILACFFSVLVALWSQVKVNRYSKVLFVAILSNVMFHSIVNSALSQSLYISSLVFALSAITYSLTANSYSQKSQEKGNNV